ncbi:hypothetical protein GLW08_14285 [Pontibacillus yanchengensis]|uniref:Uncharacterized protein n=1 Tax=Pontibacillus yanchengensis TaxID=462910 RepID=A0ACC7VII5_9BACI|nr:anti-sigma factor [Pontibacillus yanchengensis]MYL54500.1 hypothetical protein [Pontibacillus yanchengensis]
MHEQCDQLIDYFNGLLSEEEEREFENHLMSCENCQEEWMELNELTEDLPYAAEPVKPPEGMKDRVLAGVFAEEQPNETEREAPVSFEDAKEKKEAAYASPYTQSESPKRKRWLAPALAAALFLSLAGNLYTILQEEEPPDTITTDGIDQVLQSVQLEGTGSATASIVEQKDTNTLVVNANKLANLQGEQVYQVWLIKEGKPYRAGSFVPNQNGDGAVTYSLDKLQNKGKWDQIAISKEPDATSETPQGEVILSSKL